MSQKPNVIYSNQQAKDLATLALKTLAESMSAEDEGVRARAAIAVIDLAQKAGFRIFELSGGADVLREVPFPKHKDAPKEQAG